MARYQWNGENTTTDIVSALTAALAGYTTASMAKAGKAKCATLLNGAMGVIGMVGKNYTSKPMCHEVLEAVGLGGFYGLGVWAAGATTTYGHNPPGDIPVWQPKTTTAKSQVIDWSVPRNFTPPPPPPVSVAVPAPAPAGGNLEFEY